MAGPTGPVPPALSKLRLYEQFLKFLEKTLSYSPFAMADLWDGGPLRWRTAPTLAAVCCEYRVQFNQLFVNLQSVFASF